MTMDDDIDQIYVFVDNIVGHILFIFELGTNLSWGWLSSLRFVLQLVNNKLG